MCPHYPIFFTLIVLLLSIVCRSGSNCSANDVLIKDGSDHTIISPGKTFELGFFSPEGTFNKMRYLGIWYYQSNPKVVVWVANADKPLGESNGCLAIRDGNAKVLDAEGTAYWSTDCQGRHMEELVDEGELTKDPGTLSLNDAGNLIFSHRGRFSWQSFDHPTDTFLPGMDSLAISCLTSWKTRDDPAGNFTLQIQLNSQPGQTKIALTIFDGETPYWKNKGTPLDDDMPQALSELLSNASLSEHDGLTRLVMNFTGQLQFWKREAKRGWSLIWSEPKDKCSLLDACGHFGSCNSNNGLSCKCLPGFNRSHADKWNPNPRDFSGGCSPKSEACSSQGPPFWLRLPMMKVGLEEAQNYSGDQQCKAVCQNNCDCIAYSCGRTDCNEITASTETRCSIWTSRLTNLQEHYFGGFTIFVRTTTSDIALTPGGCNPCGTNIIPYPLSYAANCGDPSYFYFRCNTSTGQLDFSTSDRSFKVVAVRPEARRFTIQIMDTNHYDRVNIESHILSPESSLLFSVNNWRFLNQSFAGVPQPFTEVEMAWNLPREHPCETSLDCHYWNHTTCKAAADGKMRCICGKKFQWHSLSQTCTRVKFPLKVVTSCISGALAVVLLCGIFIIHHVRKRRAAGRQGSAEFQGDDTVAIDVPFFDWGSILAATDNFANENKLGAGGFGAVYKGKLPDGREIAVKRLSSVSEQGIEEFRTEVVLIAKLQHRNLVRLLGYCVKAHERILLYEYLPNGSLDSYLFDQTRSACLDWEKRFDIIFGIARGLLYLHQDSRLRIVHRDLKPSNILLDEEMNPKISDFGIARIVGGKETEGSTKRVIGTYGYMSPEYAYEGFFSVKSDVFSFGIVVLETISGRRNSKLFQLEHCLNLQGYAWKLWNEDRGLDLRDQALEASCNQSEVLKCIHIGLLCVQEDPSDRPTMSTVVWMLGSENASLPNPKQPAFIAKKETSDTASSSSMMDSSLNNLITFSTEGR